MNLHLDLLNPEQRAAVEHIEGPLLLLAGAGSGKTRVITHRIGYLVLRGVEPENILAVSFTNKAAREMRERVSSLIGKTIAGRATLSTFHSLGARILREESGLLGYRGQFAILDQSDTLSIVRSMLQAINVDIARVDPRQVLFLISRAKMAFQQPAELPGFRFDPVMPFAQRVHQEYAGRLRALNAVDFDDLICLPVRLFREHEEARARWAQKFTHVMVDEYQDTNHTQLLFVKELIKEHNNLCVVGDDDQSIYAFRGAVSGNILEFEAQFPGAQMIKLEQNYRSTNSILKAANQVIANNPARKEKKLWSAHGDGEPVRMVACADAREEAEYCAAEMSRLHDEEEVAWRDMAILFRSNPQSRIFEEACRTHNVPYNLRGSQEFFDRSEVKDTLCLLRTATNTADEMALRRIINVPNRGIGTTSLERLIAMAVEGRTLFNVLAAVAEKELEVPGMRFGATEKLTAFVRTIRKHNQRFRTTGGLRDKASALLNDLHYLEHLRSAEDDNTNRRRLANVEEILDSIADFEDNGGDSMEAFIARLTLDRTTNENEDDSDAIQMMTLHSSKGLEFDVVFLAGMEEMLLPHARALDEPGGVEEERRLCYVGITRARKRLTLTRSETRKRFGQERDTKPSRFLKEIPMELVEQTTAAAAGSLKEKRKEMGLKYLRAFSASLE